MKNLILLIGVCLSWSYASKGTIQCLPQKTSVCSLGACESRSFNDSNYVKMILEYDMDRLVYSRDFGKEFKNVKYEEALVWLIARPTISNVFKYNKLTHEFVEYLSMGETVITHWGACVAKE